LIIQIVMIVTLINDILNNMWLSNLLLSSQVVNSIQLLS